MKRLFLLGLLLLGFPCYADYSCHTYVINHYGVVYYERLDLNRPFQVWSWGSFWFTLHYEPYEKITFRVRTAGGRATTSQSYPFDHNPVKLSLQYEDLTFQIACLDYATVPLGN